jgi:hypothetical protein
MIGVGAAAGVIGCGLMVAWALGVGAAAGVIGAGVWMALGGDGWSRDEAAGDRVCVLRAAGDEGT